MDFQIISVAMTRAGQQHCIHSNMYGIEMAYKTNKDADKSFYFYAGYNDIINCKDESM